MPVTAMKAAQKRPKTAYVKRYFAYFRAKHPHVFRQAAYTGNKLGTR